MTLKNEIHESEINNFLDEEIKKLQTNKTINNAIT